MTLRPSLEVDLDCALVNVLLNDLSNAPVIDRVLGIDEVLHSE